MSVNEALDSLAVTANRIADERNEFKAALRALYDAVPTGYGEDRALNEALRQAEKVLEISR